MAHQFPKYLKGYQFKQSYWNDTQARRAFKEFLQTIHGLDLTSWERAGFWDHKNYHPFSLFDEHGHVVSNICIYSTNLIIEGKSCRGAQFSGVGTLDHLRRKGLNSALTQVALDWAAAEHDFVFLFAAQDALSFYNQSGFQYISEAQPFVCLKSRPQKQGLVKLDPCDPEHLKMIAKYAHRRAPASHRLGVCSPKLLLFHVLYQLSDGVYQIPDLDILLLMKRQGTELILFDVIGEKLPKFDAICPYISSPAASEISFGFEPDLLEPKDLIWRSGEKNHLHDRNDFPLRGQPFLIPKSAHA